MKKIMLIIAGALFIGVAAHAQDPSNQMKSDSSSVTTESPETPTPPPAGPTTPATPPQQQDPNLQTPPAPSTPTPPAEEAATPAYRKDMTKLDNASVPEGLKSTLSSAQFRGWEQTGSVYTNADQSVFIVEIKDDVENRIKAYRFDSSGKPIKE